MTKSNFLTVMEAGSLRIKVSAGLVSFEVFFLGLQMSAFFLCPHMVSPQTMCAHVWYLRLCPNLLFV